jgi:hypothetical protein
MSTKSHPSGLLLVLPLLLLLSAGLSLWSDFAPPPADSWLCRSGFCRDDQIARSLPPDSVPLAEALLHVDPANPYRWCDYAAALAATNRLAEARKAFSRAVDLGPDLAPVLMRAANFHFGQGDTAAGGRVASRILTLTPTFDGILFSYFTAFKTTAVPAEPRAARAWLAWQMPRASEADLLATWRWMMNTRLADEATAGALAWAFWNRHAWSTAAEVWSSWLAHPPPLLSNPRFETEPRPTPFDWTLVAHPAVALTRDHGLIIQFSGTENVSFSHVRQMAALPPGQYTLIADLSADDITTNEGPYIHVFDVEVPSHLDLATDKFRGTLPRQAVELHFAVTGQTRGVAVQVERRPSEKFDNKIAGSLHLYAVSLQLASQREAR